MQQKLPDGHRERFIEKYYEAALAAFKKRYSNWKDKYGDSARSNENTYTTRKIWNFKEIDFEMVDLSSD